MRHVIVYSAVLGVALFGGGGTGASAGGSADFHRGHRAPAAAPRVVIRGFTKLPASAQSASIPGLQSP
jgi:hypothetical protein